MPLQVPLLELLLSEAQLLQMQRQQEQQLQQCGLGLFVAAGAAAGAVLGVQVWGQGL